MRATRPISWIKAARSDFEEFPENVQGDMLSALTIAAEGSKSDKASAPSRVLTVAACSNFVAHKENTMEEIQLFNLIVRPISDAVSGISTERIWMHDKILKT